MKKKLTFKKYFKYIACAAIGALTAGCRVIGEPAPFAALLPALLPNDLAVAAFCGTVLGCIFGFSVGMIPIAAAAGAVLFSVIRSGSSRKAGISTASSAGGVYLMASCALSAFSGGGPAEFIGRTLIAAGLTALVWLSCSARRDLSSGRGISGAKLLIFSGTAVCVLMPLGSGLGSLGSVAACYILIFCAVRVGAGAAAAAAFSCALGAGLFSPACFADVLLLGVPAVICGGLFFGRPMRAAAFFPLLFLPICVLFGSDGSLALFLCSAIAAALYLMTRKLSAGIYSFLSVRSPSRGKTAACKTMVSSISEIQKRLDSIPSAIPERRPISDAIWSKVCINCCDSKSCFDGPGHRLPLLDALNAPPELTEVCRALPQCTRVSEVKKAGVEAFRRGEYMTDRAEQSAMLRRMCSGMLSALGSAIDDAAERFSYTEDRLSTSRLRDILSRGGLRPLSCTVFAGGRAEMILPKSARINELRLAAYVSEAIGLDCSRPERLELDDGVALGFEPKTAYSVEAGSCQISAADGAPGDVSEIFDCGQWSYALLSDGMGTGEQARAAALGLTGCLKDMICAGFSVMSAAGLCSALLECMLPEESFATLDLLRVNRRTGAAEIYKAGGCNSFIYSDGAQSSASAGGYPIGILDRCDIKLHRFSVKKNAAVIMLTDGALGVTSEECLEALNCGIDLPASELAALIMARSERPETSKKDDASVSVVKIGRKYG